ncbi:Uncharacterized protein FWK35_00007087 [Aphis craccivora]|uniref:THAP-type domain-containing protein n=1 Tax=Aphis craccivora TaxID=307492 RepID=A0A6G0YFY1_APHCR|nr:Uncharacterized protein FWK35_00007087 [Aphis craccivora]
MSNMICLNTLTRICSLHFDELQYAKKPLIQEMLNYPPKCRRKLKTNAVPTKPIAYCIIFELKQEVNPSPKNKSTRVQDFLQRNVKEGSDILLKELDKSIKNTTCKKSLFNDNFNDILLLSKSPE